MPDALTSESLRCPLRSTLTASAVLLAECLAVPLTGLALLAWRLCVSTLPRAVLLAECSAVGQAGLAKGAWLPCSSLPAPLEQAAVVGCVVTVVASSAFSEVWGPFLTSEAVVTNSAAATASGW